MPNRLEKGQKVHQYCWCHLRARFLRDLPRWLDPRSRRLQSSQRHDGLPNRLETHCQGQRYCWCHVRPFHFNSPRNQRAPHDTAPLCSLLAANVPWPHYGLRQSRTEMRLVSDLWSGMLLWSGSGIGRSSYQERASAILSYRLGN